MRYAFVSHWGLDGNGGPKRESPEYVTDVL